MWPPIVLLAAAYGAGLAAGLAASWTWPAALVAAGGGLVLLRRSPWVAAAVLLIAAGWAAGVWAASRERGSCVAQWRQGSRAAQLLLLDQVRRGELATALVRGERCTGPIRVRWDALEGAPGGALIAAGGTWRGTFRVRHAMVLERRASVRGAARGWMEARLDRLFGARAGMAAALVLARAGGVPRDTREEFVRAGLVHVLAISGLHVGFLAWWVGWAARRLGASPVAAGSLGAAAALGYTWLLGFPAPAMRAAWFLVLDAAARVRQRRPAPVGLLAAAALGVLAVDPMAIRSVGAWLSVAAVAGMSWARRHLRGAGPLADTLGATAFTAPITAYVFGTVAPAGLAANLAGVPLAALAVPGLLLAVLADLVSAPAGALLAAGTGLALALLEAVASLAARIPYGHLVAPAGIEAAVPWGVLLAALVWARWRRPTLPITLRRLALPAAVAAWTWAALGVVRRDGGGNLAIHFLSVGQGDAAAIRTPRGRWILVDGGPRDREGDAGRRVVVPFLRRHGATGLAAVILSHGHADHLGGLLAALDALEPGHVWEPGQPLPEPQYRDFLAAVEASGAAWQPARRGDRLAIDSVVLTVHHPDSAWLTTSLDVNENSLVVEVAYREFQVLLTGDAGIAVERHAAKELGPVELLKVGHHGSATATSEAWLERVRPLAAVISVGAGNRYGHPAPEVLARLAARGIEVYRTDRDGRVVIRTDGRTFSVETEHDHARHVGNHHRAVHHGAGAALPRGDR